MPGYAAVEAINKITPGFEASVTALGGARYAITDYPPIGADNNARKQVETAATEAAAAIAGFNEITGGGLPARPEGKDAGQERNTLRMRKQTTTVFHCARLIGLLIASAAILFSGEAMAAEAIKIGGTGNALGTMRLLGDAFGKQNPDTKVTVLPSVGTSGAIKAVPKGALDIGLSSRPLTDEEGKLGAVAVEYARTPLVFAVATKSQVKAITLDQVADIYSGKLVNWPDGSQIRPVLRQVGDDNTRQIKLMSAAIDKALSAAEQRPGMPFATTDQEAADKTESIPGALGVTTLSLINSEDRPLRALTLNGVEPTVANGSSGKYLYVKRFFLITQSQKSAAVKRFIAFIESPAGREILSRAGHWLP